MNTDTGVLKLRDTLDRETKDVYNLVIRVSDGVQFTETTVIVQVSVVILFFLFFCKKSEALLRKKKNLNIKIKRRLAEKDVVYNFT